MNTNDKKKPLRLCLNPTHEAADAFWEAWKAYGTHKHGYYESTWIAVNAAISAGGLRQFDGNVSFEFDWQYPCIAVKKDGYLMTRRDGTIRYLSFFEAMMHKLFGFYPKDAL